MKRKHQRNTSFGKHLQKLRLERQLSVSEVANYIGVSASTYREWEYGRAITGLPYRSLTEKLHVSFSELFGEGKSEKHEVLSRLKLMETLIAEIRTAL